jgi:hypothetical protein
MLTEISWWGGLTFLWLAMSFSFVKKQYTEMDTGITVDQAAFHLTFISSATILALFFYPLQSVLVQQGYLVLIVLALLSSILMYAWPGKDDEEDIQENKLEKEDDQPEEEEELGLIYELLGQGIILLPIIIAISLGAYKSIDIVKGLGLIS